MSQLRPHALSCVRAILGCIRGQRSSSSSSSILNDVDLADRVLGFGSRFGSDVCTARCVDYDTHANIEAMLRGVVTRLLLSGRHDGDCFSMRVHRWHVLFTGA